VRAAETVPPSGRRGIATRRFPHVLCGIVLQGTFLTGLWNSAATALSSQARGITPPAFSSRAQGIVQLGTFLVLSTWHSD